MSPVQLLHILWSRRYLALMFWLCCVLAAVVGVMLLPKRYTSSAQVFINLADNNTPGVSQVPAAVMRNYIATQMETIRSRSIALAVVDAEKLDQDPQWKSAFDRAGAGGDFRTWIAMALQSGLDVNRQAASDLITVSYRSGVPENAQRFANAFANTFVRSQLDMSSAASQESVTFLEERLKMLRARLVEIETARSELRRIAVERGDTSAAGAPDQAMSLPSQIAAARNAVIVARTTIQQLRTSDGIPDSTELAALRRQLGETDATIARELPQLGPQHRRIANLRVNRDVLKRDIDAMKERQKNELIAAKQQEMAAAEQRVTELTAALTSEEQARDRDVSSRAQAASLDREIESLRAQIEALVQRRERASINVGALQSNLSVISPAFLPTEASPRDSLVLSLAALFGLVFGSLAALLIEMFDRRVRCVQDIVSYSSAPLLADVTHAKMSDRLAPVRLENSSPGLALSYFKPLHLRKFPSPS